MGKLHLNISNDSETNIVLGSTTLACASLVLNSGAQYQVDLTEICWFSFFIIIIIHYIDYCIIVGIHLKPLYMKQNLFRKQFLKE